MFTTEVEVTGLSPQLRYLGTQGPFRVCVFLGEGGVVEMSHSVESTNRGLSLFRWKCSTPLQGHSAGLSPSGRVGTVVVFDLEEETRNREDGRGLWAPLSRRGVCQQSPSEWGVPSVMPLGKGQRWMSTTNVSFGRWLIPS